MTSDELMKMIEEIEKNELHKAPDYLKEVTVKKAKMRIQKEKRTKAEQLFYYKVRVFAAMAASLVLLIAMPQPQPEGKKAVFIMQNIHEKSNELCRFLNQFSNELVSKEDF